MATNPYVNKVVYGNQTVIDLTGDTAGAGDVLLGQTFHDRSGALVTGTAIGGVPEEELRDTVGWTGKNRVPFNLAECKSFNTTGTWSGNAYTLNGITFTSTVDESGNIIEIDVNGTSSDRTEFYSQDFINQYNGYILNGCPTNDSDYHLSFVDKVVWGANIDWGNGVVIDKANGNNSRYQVTVFPDKTVNHAKFYPMIRLASISDSTFEPYHESVKQTLRDAEVIEGKNLLENELLVSGTISGVPTTVNTDGSITLNGTATSAYYAIMQGGFAASEKRLPSWLQIGKSYTVSDGSGQSNKYLLVRFYDSSKNEIANYHNETFTVPSNAYYYLICIYMVNGGVASNLTFYPMIRLASETDSTYESFYIPLKDSKFDRAEQRVLGAKNFLKYPYKNTTKTQEGVTYTDNGDGSITVSSGGSASTGFSYLFLDDSNFNNILSKYIGKSVTISGGTSDVYIRFHSDVVGDKYDYGDELTIEVTQSIITSGYNLLIGVNSGETVSETIKPMLRLASDPDDTYAPYAMTNKELTDSKLSYADNGILGAQNLLPYPYYSTSMSNYGIEYTDNGDGSVTLYGETTSSGSTFNLHSKKTIDYSKLAGKTFKIYLENGSSDIYLYFEYQNTGETKQTVDLTDSTGVGTYTFPASEPTSSYFIRLAIGGNVTISSSNPVTVKPMFCIPTYDVDSYVPYAMTNKELTDGIRNSLVGLATLSTGDTTHTFTNLNTYQYAYEVWFDCADGYAPPSLVSFIASSNTQATATFSAVTSDQTGQNSTSCKIALKRTPINARYI